MPAAATHSFIAGRLVDPQCSWQQKQLFAAVRNRIRSEGFTSEGSRGHADAFEHTLERELDI